MECPVCFDTIKTPGTSITATCQACAKHFHMECLIVSEASGNKGCPMCRIVWPVALVEPDTEIYWACGTCRKEFQGRHECETHERTCQLKKE
jgi:hypothetical protein